MLSSFETHNARTLRQVAGNAVRGGMSPTDALKAITSIPAKVFGLEGYGELVDGGIANFVVWNGDPFECSTLAEQVWIHGHSVSLETRQTLLRDKYIRHLGLLR
jgi:imidazolonepropionase-like amidohydrolase